MKWSHPRPRWAKSLSASLWLVIGLTGSASGQNVFDPYRPYSAPYNASSQPDYPTNPGLPNVAREYGNFGAGSRSAGRFDNVDRFAVDEDSFGSARRRVPGVRAPYYDSNRRDTSAETKVETRMRVAEQKLAEREAAAARLEKDRNRLYQAAIKQTDPKKRAEIIRHLNQLNAGAKPTTRADASRPTAGPTPAGPIPPRRTPGFGVLAPPDGQPATGSASAIPPRPKLDSERRAPTRTGPRSGSSDDVKIPPRPAGTTTSTPPPRP